MSSPMKVTFLQPPTLMATRCALRRTLLKVVQPKSIALILVRTSTKLSPRSLNEIQVSSLIERQLRSPGSPSFTVVVSTHWPNYLGWIVVQPIKCDRIISRHYRVSRNSWVMSQKEVARVVQLRRGVEGSYMQRRPNWLTVRPGRSTTSFSTTLFKGPPQTRQRKPSTKL